VENNEARKMSTLIGDIRAVNKWELIEPQWDGITLPRPKSVMEATSFEIQIRRVVVSDGVPVLSDWMPIPVFDHYPENVTKEAK
jgi:hypothetical protein